MSRYNHKHKRTGREILWRTLFALASIAILVVFMPRQTITHYQYRLGEPWDDSPLIAQDSFPIYKSDAQLKREKDSLSSYYEYYFLLDSLVVRKQQQTLRQQIQRLPSGLVPAYYLPHLLEKLRYVYEQGILETSDFEQLQTDSTQYISVIADHVPYQRTIGEVFTTKSAYEYLMKDSDSIRYVHDKLLRCDLQNCLQPNLSYDEEKSLSQRQDIDNLLVPYLGQVLVGQKIVDRGQIVDKHTFDILRSLELYLKHRDRTTKEKILQTTGQVLYISILVLLLIIYFEQFRSDYLDRLRSVLLIAMLSLIFPLCTYALVSHSLMSVYIIPYCMLPILIRIFMDSRTAFMLHILTILACAVSLRHPYEFIITQSVAGLTAIFSLRQLSQRSELFRAAVFVTLASLLTYFCIDLLHGNFTTKEGVDRWTYIYLTLAGVLSLLSYLLLIPIERVFGFTSNVTLVELSNINNKVLHRLSEEAPGTFQHSMQVANLAAEVANHIGAKSQLVRTGALYHDIGKLENAVFFTENQSGINPHDQLSYEQSAQIIIQHVRNGIKLADKYKLPQVIKEFILTHHGRSVAKYFYISYKNKYPGQPVNEALFTYPGPNPSTVEQAILMMSDAVEAASRSLQQYTEESICQMVDKIVDEQVASGYFSQCPITFLEIAEAKEIFKSKLRTIYHTRIQYPELIKKEG